MQYWKVALSPSWSSVRCTRVNSIPAPQIRCDWMCNLVLVSALLLVFCIDSHAAPDPAINCTDTASSKLSECAQTQVPDNRSADQVAELTRFLASWLKVWGRGDIEGYFDHYVGDVSPNPGLSRQQWEKQRRRSVSPARNIQVTIELESMGIDDQHVIDVVFLQRYKAKGYQDVTKKQLFLVWQGKNLKITREQTVD